MDYVSKLYQIMVHDSPLKTLKMFATKRYQSYASPLYHLQSNGEAERFILTFKSAMQKAKQGGKAVKPALRNFLHRYSITLHCTIGIPPCKRLMKFDLLSTINHQTKQYNKQRLIRKSVMTCTQAREILVMETKYS